MDEELITFDEIVSGVTVMIIMFMAVAVVFNLIWFIKYLWKLICRKWR